jgi:ADP-heptose:LPS heptosyltransferase
MPNTQKKIIVIKHGALGDMINAMGAFSLIRSHHRDAHITLLTGKAYGDLARKTGFFDDIAIDSRDRFYRDYFRLRARLKGANRVYDLQNSPRTSLYYLMLYPGKVPQWNGIAPFCDFPQRRLDREDMHAYDRFADQLAQAGLGLDDAQTLYPDMSWLTQNSALVLPRNSILLVPGSSRTGQYKRWPAEYYGELAQHIMDQGYSPVLIAGPDDLEVASRVKEMCPGIIDLTLKVNFLEIAMLAKQAIAVVGNDTGPLHILAAMKLPTLVLWSKASPPHVYAPKGPHVHIAYEEDLKNLSLERVKKLVWGTLVKKKDEQNDA